MKLQTFQLLSRLAELDEAGVISGDWEYVLGGCDEAYRGMVQFMERVGVDTAGCPPIWAWHGPLHLWDASSLFDPEHELVHGFATVDLEVPDEMIVLSDYGQWCEYLMTPVSELGEWVPDRIVPTEGVLVQACLPLLRAEWVRAVRPLPRTGWDELDDERLA